MSAKIVGLLLATLCTIPAGSFAQIDNNYSAPSIMTRQAIEDLAPQAKPITPNLKSLIPSTSKLPNKGAGQSPSSSVPFVAQNSIILQFQPSVTDKQITDYIKSKKLQIIRTFPSLGAIQVQIDLSKYFKPRVTDNDSSDAVLRGLIAASKEFKKNPIVREATPDLILQGQADITNFMVPTAVQSVSTKIDDWGIRDIEADKLWSLPGAQDGTIFGIMDVGFTKHEDLTFLELEPNTPVADHGTHVSGIACGSHSNQRGIRGVLPNCFVRARYGNVFFQSAEGGKVTQFMVLFSQILGSLQTFVEGYDDVTIFNISLGYNWETNFNINPDAPESKEWRALVELQGALLVTLLQNAEKKKKMIFSAAGNDSENVNPPIMAKYASPFNWAAITARAQGIKNGVIVEAHDQDGKRASFSNVGGNISCPGVNILSTVAYDDQHKLSSSAYGKMSGTSMASPYCAAGLALFRLVRPKYSAEASFDCLEKSKEKSTSNTPMMRLKEAVDVCP